MLALPSKTTSFRTVYIWDPHLEDTARQLFADGYDLLPAGLGEVLVFNKLEEPTSTLVTLREIRIVGTDDEDADALRGQGFVLIGLIGTSGEYRVFGRNES